jgi:transposase/quinol monooxygenase YgiN
MLIRIFRAQLKPGAWTAFLLLCEEHSVPLMRAQPGCLGTHIGVQSPASPNVFAVVSMWRDLESLQAFVGENWQASLILPGEADLLERVIVEHYSETYRSLLQLWRAHANLVKRREVAALTAPLTDSLWAAVIPQLPARGARGRPRADDRRTLDGILYVLRTGCRWRDLPPCYGDPVTCWRRFTRWESDGTWERIWCALLDRMGPADRCVWALAFRGSRAVPTQPGRQAGRGRLALPATGPSRSAP